MPWAFAAPDIGMHDWPGFALACIGQGVAAGAGPLLAMQHAYELPQLQ